MKFKTVAIFINGGHYNQEKSMIFRQFARIAGCVRSIVLAQKRKPRIQNFRTTTKIRRRQSYKANPSGKL